MRKGTGNPCIWILVLVFLQVAHFKRAFLPLAARFGLRDGVVLVAVLEKGLLILIGAIIAGVIVNLYEGNWWRI